MKSSNNKPGKSTKPRVRRQTKGAVVATQATETVKQSRIVRRPELQRRIGVSAAHIDRMEQGGEFCRRIALGLRAVGWLSNEVDEWIQARADNRSKKVIK